MNKRLSLHLGTKDDGKMNSKLLISPYLTFMHQDSTHQLRMLCAQGKQSPSTVWGSGGCIRKFGST